MPQVPGAPYEPYPTVSPAERVLRPGGVPFVPDAYGAGVARAVSTFGGDVQEAGKEVFNAALDYRKTQIEMGVRDAVNGWYNDTASPAQNTFLSSKGEAATSDAAHAHLTDLDAGRRAARDKIQNQFGVYGASQFDADTAAIMRSLGREATYHAISETGKAQDATYKNSAEVSRSLVYSAPQDDKIYGNEKAKALKDEADYGQGRYTTDEITQNQKDAVSTLAFNRISSLARADTNGTGAAFDLLDRLKKNGDLSSPADIENAEKIVRTRYDTASNALIASKEQNLLDEVRATGASDGPKAKRIQGEIDAVRARRVALGEAQPISDRANEELQVKVGAAKSEYKVNTELRGTSPFQGMIDKSAADHGLNPVLLARQLHQESGLNPNVHPSSAGAQGIAQFMPATAKQYGVDVTSPASSIEGAAHYMEDLTRQFGGNTGLALAAYNWGPDRVAAWVAAGSKPGAMPLETKNYVKAITGLSISDWQAGERPDMATLKAPEGAAGSVQRAAQLVDQMRTDPSVPASQRDANAAAGEKVIQKYVEDNIRLANQTEVKQRQVDDSFRSDVMQDSRKERPEWTEQRILNLPDAVHGGPSATAKETMIKWLRSEGMPGPSPRESSSNAMQLFQRLRLPDGDPQKITDLKTIDDAAINGLISKADHDWLENKYKEPLTPGGERLSQIRAQLSKRVGPVIEKTVLGNIDQSGQLQAYRWEHDLDAAIDQYRKDGKDPMDLFDPNKPDFFGSDKRLQEYLVPFSQAIENVQRRITGGGALPAPTSPTITTAPGIPGTTPAYGPPASPQAPVAPPRRPGETPIQYMQRTAPAEGRT